MPLSIGQQAVLYTIALVLVGVGALGTVDALKVWGFPPLAGFIFLVMGVVGSAIIKAYGLQQQAQLKQQLKSKS